MASYRSSQSLESGSSSSSFGSSSLGRTLSVPSSTYHSDTPSSSTASASTIEPSLPHKSPRSLDLGPPGYQATILLFEGLPNEHTVYLGPWRVVDADHRRVVWQCSYEGETLEQFRAYDLNVHACDDAAKAMTVAKSPASQAQPFTVHSQHRPYSDPTEMELFVMFREPQRVRYTSADGTLVHDAVVEVKYEFTSVESSGRFQGDLRGQDLVDYFDVDVVFSDTHSRTDSISGAVRGMATIQRIKLWKDRHSPCHCITFYSNKPSTRRERRYRDYLVTDFHETLKGRDDKHRECRLGTVGRRGSAPDAARARSFSIASPSSWGRLKPRCPARTCDTTAAQPASPSMTPLDIRWLGIRFSRETDYRRFMARWAACHSADREFRGGMPFATRSHVELPPPAIQARLQQAFASDAAPATPRGLGLAAAVDLEPLGERTTASEREPPPDWPLRNI